MSFDKRRALQSALLYTQQGKWDKAIAEYQTILRSDASDLTVCNNLGDLFARAGRVAEAIEQYRKLGESYRADGLSVKAIAVYKKIAKLDPSWTEAYLACADLYLEQGLVGEAKLQLATVAPLYAKLGDAGKVLEITQRLTQLDPTNLGLSTRYADLLLKQGQTDAAAGEYERAAGVAQGAGHPGEAERLRRKARELAPPGVPTLATAQRLVDEGRTADAIEALLSVTAGDPANGPAWRLLGDCYAGLNQDAEALRALTRAVEQGVPERDVAGVLGRRLLALGRRDEAVALGERLVEEALGRGEPAAAVAACRGLLDGEPGLLGLHRRLVELLDAAARDAEAAEARRALIEACEAAGDAAAAAAACRELLARDPLNAWAAAKLRALAPPPAPATALAPDAEVVDLVPVKLLLAGESPAPDALDPPAAPEPAPALAAEPALPVAEVTQPSGSASPAPIAVEPVASTPDGVAAPSAVEAAPLATLSSLLEAEAPLATPDGEEARGREEGAAEPPLLRDEEATGGRPAAIPAPEPPAAEPVIDDDVPFAPTTLAAITGTRDGAADADAADAILATEVAGAEPPLITLPEARPLLEALGPATSPASESLDFLGDSSGWRGLDAEEGEEALSGQAAEHLAEAEVYLKYGIEERARERLRQVVRLSPNSITVRRKLKRLYLEQHDTEAACDEMAAIARILLERRRGAAAHEEIRSGLALAPDHPALRLLADGGGDALAPGLPAPPPSEPRPGVEAEEAAPTAATPHATAGPPPADAPAELLPAVETPPADAGATTAEPSDGLLSLMDLPEPPALPTDAPAGPAEEELSAELRALLDEPGEEILIEAVPLDGSGGLTDDLAEAEFYLSQGMDDEARAVCRRLEQSHPDHPAVLALAARLGAAETAGVADPPGLAALDEAASLALVLPPAGEPAPPTSVDALAAPVGEAAASETAVDVEAAIPPSETPALDPDGADAPDGPGPDSSGEDTGILNGLITAIQHGADAGAADAETHYNLGVAYKEMDLFDEAIHEFRLALADGRRRIECAELLAQCHLAKGEPEAAVGDLLAGLAEGGASEASRSLRYTLGLAYEAQGDDAAALEQFEQLQGEDPRFRDVQSRLLALRAQVKRAVPPAPAPPAAPPRKRRKISFI